MRYLDVLSGANMRGLWGLVYWQEDLLSQLSIRAICMCLCLDNMQTHLCMRLRQVLPQDRRLVLGTSSQEDDQAKALGSLNS